MNVIIDVTFTSIDLVSSRMDDDVGDDGSEKGNYKQEVGCVYVVFL